MMLGHSGKAIVLLLAGAPVAQAGFVFETVVLSGQAPHLPPELSVARWFASGINSAGMMIVGADLQGPGLKPIAGTDIEYLVESPGSLAVIARQGTPAPNGLPYFLFASSLSDQGDLVIDARFIGGDPLESTAYFHGTAGALSVLADEKHGTTAPGYPDGHMIAERSLATLRMNDAGEVAFTAHVGEGPFAKNGEHVLYTGTPDNLQRHVMSGREAPGVAAGVTFGQSFSTLNNRGEVGLRSALFQNGVGYFGDALYAGPVDTLTLVALSGGQAPGAPKGTVHRAFSLLELGDGGHVMYSARLDGDEFTPSTTGLFFGASDSPTLVGRTYFPVDGLPTGVVCADFPTALRRINGNGRFAYGADLTAPSGPYHGKEGLFVGTGDQPELALLSKEIADFALNELDQIAIVARGVGSQSAWGLYIVDAALGVTTVVESGDLFEVEAGDLRTVASTSESIHISAKSLNDHGLLQFALRFTDGSSGVFTVQVPAPGAGLAVLIPAGALLASRRRPAQPA